MRGKDSFHCEVLLKAEQGQKKYGDEEDKKSGVKILAQIKLIKFWPVFFVCLEPKRVTLLDYLKR